MAYSNSRRRNFLTNLFFPFMQKFWSYSDLSRLVQTLQIPYELFITGSTLAMSSKRQTHNTCITIYSLKLIGFQWFRRQPTETGQADKPCLTSEYSYNIKKVLPCETQVAMREYVHTVIFFVCWSSMMTPFQV